MFISARAKQAQQPFQLIPGHQGANSNWDQMVRVVQVICCCCCRPWFVWMGAHSPRLIIMRNGANKPKLTMLTNHLHIGTPFPRPSLMIVGIVTMSWWPVLIRCRAKSHRCGPERVLATLSEPELPDHHHFSLPNPLSCSAWVRLNLKQKQSTDPARRWMNGCHSGRECLYYLLVCLCCVGVPNWENDDGLTFLVRHWPDGTDCTSSHLPSTLLCLIGCHSASNSRLGLLNNRQGTRELNLLRIPYWLDPCARNRWWWWLDRVVHWVVDQGAKRWGGQWRFDLLCSHR